MNIKIIQHIMPWEIDYALLTYMQLKKSKYHIPSDVNIVIETELNLSSYIIDWDNSKLPKEFFIEKYDHISLLLNDYKHTKKIYDENKLYGCLDSVRNNIDTQTDYYLSICPDMYFSEYTIPYLIESARQIHNKYFVITPEISKLWDWTWDEITNPQYLDISYNDWDKADIFDIRYNNKFSNKEISLRATQRNKWAGWCDLYNKAFYEELCPMHDDWAGYGPWDWYSMMITEYAKQNGVDFQQYVLQGETIFEYSVGPLKNENVNGFSKYYKDMLSLNDIPNQRQQFESKMQEYLQKGIQQLKNKNII
jgi:hypothetical protein